MTEKRRRLSSKKPKKKTSAAKSKDLVWFSVRRILDEKSVQGRISYLVDWEDNKDTGKPYDPEWIEKQDVTLDVIQEWEAEKSQRATQAHSEPQQDLASAPESDHSQPPRSAERRRIPWSRALASKRRRAASAASSSASEPPRKTQRLDSAATPSEEPELDLTSTLSNDSASEVNDPTYQIHVPRAITVELTRKSDLDPSEYLSFTDSQASSQSLAELEAQDSQIALPHSQRTIPDSQDPSDLSSSHLRIPETPVSRLIPNSLTEAEPTDTDIPSHQPEDTIDAEGAELYETTPPPAALIVDPISRTSESSSPRRVTQQTTQATDNPIIATQPEFVLSFPLPTSSITTSGAALPNHLVFEVTSPREEEEEAHLSNSGEPQNAQRLTQVLDSIEEPFPDSQSAPANFIDQQNLLPIPSQPALSIVQEGPNVSLDESPSSLAYIRPSSPVRSQIMDDQGTGRGSSPPRMSATEELSRLFGLEPDPEPVVESNEKSNPEPADTTIPESVPQVQPQAEIPIHLSVGLEAQPADSTTAWNQDASRSNPELVESIAPLDILSQPHQSATEALLKIVEMSFPSSSSRITDLQPSHHTPEIENTTVSPADITRQDGSDQPDVSSMPSLLIEEAVQPKLYEISGEVSSQTDHAHSDHDDSSKSPSSLQDLAQDYLVTLPFQASLRPIYDEIFMEYKKAITNFSHAFSSEIYIEPQVSLISKIEELFGRLYNLCDYPRDVIGTPMEELPPRDIAKYCCDANSKFSFVFEFLQGLQRGTKVFIVARSPELLRLIHHLTVALQLDCRCDAIGKPKSEFEHSNVQVVLAIANEPIDSSGFDVVIGFDSSFPTSHFMQQSPSRQDSHRQQLVLVLAITHSIEHIRLQISETPEVLESNEMEQKNALIIALARMRKLMVDPDRNYLEPHQIATMFCKFLNGEESIIPWEPQALPDDALDVFYSSQFRSQMPVVSLQDQENGRKRKLDSLEDSDVKRMRIFASQELEYDAKANQPPLPDEVRGLLEAATLKQKTSKPEVMVRVPLSLLEVFVQQASEYERRIKDASIDAEYKAIITNLENRNKEHERMTRKIYESNRAALEDRSRFEAEAQKAELARKAAVDAAEREAENFKKKIAGLEESMARLTQDPNSSSQPEDTPLAKNEKLLQEAVAQIALLEKRLENSKEDGSYIRNAYQDATLAASAMKVELDLLQEQNKELSRKASENAVRIQQIQAQNTVTIYVRQIGELKAQMKEIQVELDRSREELRQLKNGRRETRGVSVPHSPRMGIMSPRMGRGYGPASRGNSPAPVVGGEGTGTPHNGQPGNNRWTHLRE